MSKRLWWIVWGLAAWFVLMAGTTALALTEAH